MTPEVFIAGKALLGEGPCWDAERGRLLWVDILSHELHLSEQSRTQTFQLGDYVSAALPTSIPTVLLIALGAGVALLDLQSGEVEPIAATGGDPRNMRVNDAKLDPQGRLWLGTMSVQEFPERGALYRLDEDGTMRKALDRVSISNGPAWSPAGDLMYHVDSPTRSIKRFDFDSAGGELGRCDELVDTSRWRGLPDGIAVDLDGNLWVAFWDGGCVRCFSPEGRLLDCVRLPVARPTSCAFGGPELRRLLITSARVGLTPGELVEQPLAGSVLAVDPGVAGLPQANWPLARFRQANM